MRIEAAANRRWPRGSSRLGAKNRRIALALGLIGLVAAGLPCVAGARQAAGRPGGPQGANGSPAQVPFDPLVGRWVRPDGGYMIGIRSVNADGTLDAAYANPGPLPFAVAQATREAGEIRLFFELRAGGYNGSTYRLTYDAAQDVLRGVYFQAVARQRFDVVFVRAR